MGKAKRKKVLGGKELALACVKVANDKKALDIMVLDMREISSVADYFFLCSGTSDRQVKAIAEGIQCDIKGMGLRSYHSEGWSDAKWVVLDFGDLIAHIFCDETRKYYQLERLWGDAKLVVGS